jgi:recombination protein RecA
LAPPFRQCEFDILYNEGISKLGELIDIGVEQGIIEKSGAWYTYKKDRIGQGKENARDYLKEHADTAAEIEARIREKTVTARTGGSGEAEAMPEEVEA